MKKYYEKTRLNYIVMPAILLLYASIMLVIFDRRSGIFNMTLIMNLGYLLLLVLSVGQTIRERRDFNEVIACGMRTDGIIKEIVLIRYETCISKTDAFDSNRYEIKVETIDGSGSVLHTYSSDLIKKRAIRHVPRKVQVYNYMGRICIVWEKSKTKEFFPVKKSKEIQKGNGVRMILNYTTCLFLMMYVGTTVGVVIDLSNSTLFKDFIQVFFK